MDANLPVFHVTMSCPKCGRGEPNSFCTKYVAARRFPVRRPERIVWKCYFCSARIECAPIQPPPTEQEKS